MNSTNLGNKSCVVIVGIIASVLTLFSFLTGIFSIKDIFPNNSSNSYNSSPPQAVATEVPYQADTQIATNTTAITASEDSSEQNNLNITLLAGGAPLKGNYLSFLISPASKDIVGKWTALEDSGQTYEPDVNGVISASLSPGDYALVYTNVSQYHASLGGSWGTVGMNPSGHHEQMTVFSINPGEKTNIEIPLATLEIGLLSKSGDALREKHIEVSCQGTDVSGKKIRLDYYDETGCATVTGQTDATGLVSFNLGAGIYVIYISEDPPASDDIQQDIYKFDINLAPSEVKRIIINVP